VESAHAGHVGCAGDMMAAFAELAGAAPTEFERMGVDLDRVDQSIAKTRRVPGR